MKIYKIEVIINNPKINIPNVISRAFQTNPQLLFNLDSFNENNIYKVKCIKRYKIQHQKLSPRSWS